MRGEASDPGNRTRRESRSGTATPPPIMIYRRDSDIAAGLAPLGGVAEDGRGIWILPQATFRGIEERHEPPFKLGKEFPGHDIPWNSRSAEWRGCVPWVGPLLLAAPMALSHGTG